MSSKNREGRTPPQCDSKTPPLKALIQKMPTSFKKKHAPKKKKKKPNTTTTRSAYHFPAPTNFPTRAAQTRQPPPSPSPRTTTPPFSQPFLNLHPIFSHPFHSARRPGSPPPSVTTRQPKPHAPPPKHGHTLAIPLYFLSSFSSSSLCVYFSQHVTKPNM